MTKRSLWPHAIVATFVALALFDLNIVRLALLAPSQPIEARPYEAGLRYEEFLEGVRATNSEGVRFTVNLTEQSAQVGASGMQSPGPYTVRLDLLRPDSAELDQFRTGTSALPQFQFDMDPLRAGLWLVRVSVKGRDRTYNFESREFVDVPRRVR